MPLQFDTTLSEADWDKRFGGWQCDALALPSASVAAIFYDGQKADDREYAVDGTRIRWATPSHPAEAIARIEITADLAGIEKEKVRLEDEKLGIEREKIRSEQRWKLAAAIGAVLSALISAFVTIYVSKPAKSTAASAIEAKLGSETLALFRDLPPNSISMLLDTGDKSMRLVSTGPGRDEWSLPLHYDSLKALGSKGLLIWNVPAEQYDEGLARYGLTPVVKDHRLVLQHVTPTTEAARQLLESQGYKLSDKGSRVLEAVTEVAQSQIYSAAVRQ